MLLARGYTAAILAILCTLSNAAPSAVAPADSLITEPARLVRREPYDYNDFIGYYSATGTDTYTASTCYGVSYASRLVAGTWYGGCQDTSVLSVFTACSGDYAYGLSIFRSGTYTTTSTTYSSCYSTCISDVLEYYPSASESYFVQCEFRTPITMYRTPSNVLPALSMAAASSSTIDLPTTTTTTPYPGPTSPIITPTPVPKKKVPLGAILGGVFGSIAFILLVCLGIFFILKHRHNHGSHAAAQNQPVMMSPPGAGFPPAPQQTYQPPQQQYPQPGDGIQQNYIPGMAAMPLPEKTVQQNAYPVSPGSPHQSWNSNVPPQMGISPPGSPPPTYPYPNQPQQQYGPGPGQPLGPPPQQGSYP